MGRWRIGTDYAEDIHCSGKHLLDLINDLLDMAKIEAGQLEYHEEPVCLLEILGEAIRLTRLLESDARHTLDLDVPEPLPACSEIAAVSSRC